MATAKKASKTTAKKSTGKSMVSWADELARRAAIARATADSASHGGAKQIKIVSGRLQIDGADVPDNKMNCVVLDYCLEHAIYAGKYDSDNPTPPIAWALGRIEDELVWSDKSHEDYAGIRALDSEENQFGSADQGRGKAAKNIARLMLISEDDLDDIPGAEPRMLKLPVTSVKNWLKFVKDIDALYTYPPCGVLVEISVVPDAKSQFKVLFKLVEQLDEAFFEELFPKVDSVEEDLFKEYEPLSDEEIEERESKNRRPVKKNGAKRNVAVAKKAAPAKVVPQRQGKRQPAGKAPQAEARKPVGKASKAAPAAAVKGKRKF